MAEKIEKGGFATGQQNSRRVDLGADMGSTMADNFEKRVSGDVQRMLKTKQRGRKNITDTVRK